MNKVYETFSRVFITGFNAGGIFFYMFLGMHEWMFIVHIEQYEAGLIRWNTVVKHSGCLWTL